MTSVVRSLKAIYCLVKAVLGLPYVSMGILVLLALTWLNKPPDLILTATLMCAFPVSWLCRLQCEREQRFYKNLCMNSKSKRQKARSTKALFSRTKSCPVCNKTISKDNNFCPYCATDLRRKKLQRQPIPETATTLCPKCRSRLPSNANFCANVAQT